MKFRIVSRPDEYEGWRYYVERLWLGLVWLPVRIPTIGFLRETSAKNYAERIAQGAWVTDVAAFPPHHKPAA